MFPMVGTIFILIPRENHLYLQKCSTFSGGFGVARNLGSPQQFTILLALQTCPLNGVGVVGWKTVTEIERQALIQQNLHAILASKESLASSSA